MSLAGVDMAGVILGVFGGDSKVLTLRRKTAGARGGDVLLGTNPTSTDTPCRGFDEARRTMQDNLTIVTVEEICIYGASLPPGIEPRAGDLIIDGGTIYTITEEGVTTDSQRAVFVCQVAL